MAAPSPIDADSLATRHPGPSQPRRTTRVPNEPRPVSGPCGSATLTAPNRRSSAPMRVYQTNPRHLLFSTTYILTTKPTNQTNPSNPRQPSTSANCSAILSPQEGSPCVPFSFV